MNVDSCFAQWHVRLVATARSRRAAGGAGVPDFIASDGVSIVYDDRGSGRSVVLLHGLMAHRGFFRAQAPLARSHRLVVPDLRGMGGSRAHAGLTVARLAADIAELADALDLEGAVAVGWSLGAAVMWELLAGPAAWRFAGAAVVDMTPCTRNTADWTLGLSPGLCEARREAIEADFPAFAAGAGQAIFAQPIPPECQPVADWASAEFARNDPHAIARLWSSLVEQDSRAQLARITQPTLIVHGAGSHLYGEETAAYLEGAIPWSRRVTFARSGHSPLLEEPELFNRTLSEFAASLPPVRQRQSA